MKHSLVGNEVIGTIDFIEPLKHDPETKRDKIRAWARDIIEKAGE